MAIKDLKAKEGNVDLVVEITDKANVREFQKFGKPGRVCNAKAKDDTGEIVLTLWNDDVDKVKVGDKVHIINGYVGEWQGELQLGTGRYGKLEVIEGKEVTQEEATITDEMKTDKGEKVLTEDEKVEEEVLDETGEEEIEY